MTFRIEICGPVASGKTTLARSVARRARWAGAFENFRDRPFWREHGSDPERFEFAKNLSFVVSHAELLYKALQKKPKFLVTDFSLYVDLAFVKADSHGVAKRTTVAAIKTMNDLVGPANMIIELYARPEVLARRANRRGRSAEKHFDRRFFALQSRLVRESIRNARKAGVHVLRVDTSIHEKAALVDLVVREIRSVAATSPGFE